MYSTNKLKWQLLGVILLFFCSIFNGYSFNDTIPVIDPSLTIPGYDEQKANGILYATTTSSDLTTKDVYAQSTNFSMMMNSGCFIPVDPTYTTLPRNDDGFVGPINIPFTFNLYGVAYNAVYINTNGNISFGQGVNAFSSTGFPFNIPMVAPFWADVDTDNPLGGQIHYKIFPTHMIVTWDGVGYYDNKVDKLNTFQVIIGTMADTETGIDNNVCFRYGDMQWTTGDAGGGVDGFLGIPATVGINSGDGVNFTQVGRFNQDNSDYDGPGGDNDGVHYLDNQCSCFDISGGGNQPPVANVFSTDVVALDCGETESISFQFIGPEIGQTVTTTVDAGGLCGVTHSVTNGTTSNGTIWIDAMACNVGNHTITVNAVDNGVPSQTTTRTISVTIANSGSSLPVPTLPTLPTISAQCEVELVPPTATGACGELIIGTTNDPLIYTTQGTHVVTWTYTGANNNVTIQTQTVVINDTEPPVMSCPLDITLPSQSGLCGRYIEYETPTALDNCGQPITFLPNYTYLGEHEGHVYYMSHTYVTAPIAYHEALAVGGHLVTINSAEENNFLVDVLPSNWFWTNLMYVDDSWQWGTNEPLNYINWWPGHPLNLLEYNWSLIYGNWGRFYSYFGGYPTRYIVEFDGPAVPVNLVSGLPSGSFFPIGETLVEWEAIDGAGNMATCSFTVTVNDTEYPVITNDCPETIEVCGARNMQWTPPTATDNCEVIVSSSHNPGDYFSVGAHTVEYTFADLAGNSVSCEFEIIVHPYPDVEITESAVPLWCQGVSILTAEVNNFSDLLPPITYQWSHGLGTTPSVIVPDNGVYNVEVADGRGCTVFTFHSVNEDLSELFSAYTIVVDEELEMHESEVLNGGVGVMDADEVEIEDNTTIHDFLLVDVDELDMDNSSTVGTLIDDDFDLPLPPFVNNPHNNYQTLDVAAGTTMTLNQNNYGYIIVRAGATLIIDTDLIYIRRLRTYDNVTIEFTQTTDVIVKSNTKLGRFGNINPTGQDVIFYGRDNVKIGHGSTVVLDIYCDDDLEVNDSGSAYWSTMTGMFIAENIASGDKVEWNWNLNCNFNYQIYGLGAMNSNEDPIAAGFKLYPNPTDNLLNIDLSDYIGQSITITVTDILGRQVLQKNSNDNVVLSLDLAELNLKEGMYILSIDNGELVSSKRFVYSK